MNKISCLKANCTLCKYAVLKRVNKFGDRFYACLANEKPHPPINAYNCNYFRCNKEDDNLEMCRTCKKGNII